MQAISYIIVAVMAAVVTSIITSRILATYYFEIIDGFLKKHDKDVMDLISWAKGVNKHQ